MLNRNVVESEEQVVKLIKRKFYEVGVCDLSIAYWTHYNLISTFFKHHDVGCGLITYILFHLSDYRILVSKSEDVGARFDLDNISLRSHIDIYRPNSDNFSFF